MNTQNVPKPVPVLCPNFTKGNGLVTVVVQHQKTKQILMVAHANQTAYLLTLTNGKAVFWSRSRNKLWEKGEGSGHTLTVHQILVDCDGGALIYVVTPNGPTCHTEAGSCFYRDVVVLSYLEPAPKAGEKEELEEMRVPVHPDIVTECRLAETLRRVAAGQAG